MRTILKHASRKAAGDKRKYWMICARAAADQRLTQGARNRRSEIVRAKDNVPVVTLSDRAEAVVAVLTAIDAQAGGAVMASRQVRVTGRAVLDRGE
jgi:hypothetical protein